MNASTIWDLVKKTFSEWNEDKSPRLAAALAYYTLFSIAPLLVIAISLAGLVLQRDAVESQVLGQVSGLMGESGREAVEGMIQGASNISSGIVATALGVAALLLGATGFFGQLQDALNTIWEVQPKPGQGLWATVKQRFFSFSMVLGTAFLLLVSLVVSSVLATLSEYFQGVLPGADWIWSIVNFVVSFGVTTLIFALIFKVVPDVEIAWGDVWIGALVTALLFSIGRFALAEYLGRGSFSSTYGAAASLVILLLWVYYSAQILFLGAEFTQVYARSFGSRIRPAENAVSLTEKDRAKQGIPRREQVEAAAGQQGAPQMAETGAPRRSAAVPDERSIARRPTVVSAVLGFIVGMTLARRNNSRG